MLVLRKVQSDIRWKFILLSLIFLLGWSSSAVAQRCEVLFRLQPAAITELQNKEDLAKLSKLEKAKESLKLFMARFKPQTISKPMVAELFKSVKSLLADTTGKRIENKVTATSALVKNSLEKFKTNLAARGLKLTSRDLETEGRRNVTYTEYTQPFGARLSDMQDMGFEVRDDLKNRLDKELTVKIRVRSYGTVPDSKTEIELSDVEFAKFTKDRVFVELKFKDPSYEGAVFKPQAYIKKEYAKMFGTPEFLKRFDEIKADTLANLKISSKKTLDSSSVEAMLEFIRQAHQAELNLSTVAINLYERTAKSVVLNYNSALDPDFDAAKYGAVSKVELQMTFDQLISLFVPGDKVLGENQYYKAYAPDETVSEFKTPTMIAHHLKRAADEAQRLGRPGFVVTAEHAALLEKILPGLTDYLNMMDEIIQSRVPEKELNRGKWGIALKKIKTEIEKLLNQFYTDSEPQLATP